MLKFNLFIHHDSGDNGIFFKQSIERINPAIKIELFLDFTSFEVYLKKPYDFKNNEVFILFADSIERLNRLYTFINFFEGKRLLLVAPDERSETTSKVLKFWPRFFTYIRDNYEDFCSVIKKIAIKEEIIPLQRSIEIKQTGKFNP